jgi:hypothetical protein
MMSTKPRLVRGSSCEAAHFRRIHKFL